MRLIIEARLPDEDCDVVEDDGVVIVTERRDRSLSQLGLTLAEGRSLLAKVQSVLVAKQVTGWSSGQTHCRRCRAALSHKDSRSTVLRTIYGKVTVKSPRLWSCACQQTSSSPQQVIHPPVQSPAQPRHAGVGISPGEVGCAPAVPAGHEHVQGSAAARQGDLVQRHP